MDKGRYNLAWNEFESCTSNSFKGLIAREEFVDVTLACDDDKQVKAHKVILSACSEFFRNILLKNSHQHPLIYLDNLKVDNLQALIDFMYLGETNIPQDMFSGFIKAAQKYKIKGLAEHSDDMAQVRTKKRRHLSVNKASTPVSIKEECVSNEEPPVEVLKHTIVGTLANNQAKMMEPETKFEVLDEEINEEVSNVVQVELTEVDVVEPMEESDVDSLLLDEEMDSVNDNNIEDANAGLTLETPNDNLTSEVDKAGEYLPNENEIFSEEESEEEEEGVGNGSIEEGIEIESIVDRNEAIPSIESDIESLGENDDSSDDDYEEEEESSEDDEESIADEDTECDEDENTDEEGNNDEDEVTVKEERAADDDEFANDDIEPNPVANVQEEEKLLIENNNKESIKKEQTLDDSDFEFL